MNYDAILVVSFGGPECPEDVIPFLENVLRGRNVPREACWRWPNTINISAARARSTSRPVSWLRPSRVNWPARAEIARLLGQSQLASHAGRDSRANEAGRHSTGAGLCHLRVQFLLGMPAISRRHCAGAREAVGFDAPEVDKLRAFFNHPGFIEATEERLRDALQELPAEARQNTQIVYVAHSIPPRWRRCATMCCSCRKHVSWCRSGWT